jgi:LacI family transcriptional regulator
MKTRLDSQNQARISPTGMFALLREQTVEAIELKARSEAMAEQWQRNPSHQRPLIGLISCLLPIPNPMHPIFEKMLLGIRSHLTANDCDLLLCATRPLGANESLRRAAALQTIDRGVNALIAWGIAYDDPEFEPILSSGLPVIFVDNDVLDSRAGSVTSANIDGMVKVVGHLYETGHRRIAHISGHFNTRPGTDRLFGYRSELDKLGLPAPAEYLAEGDFFHDSGFEAMKGFLALPQPPDAVACASDAMAVGAMAAIEEAGLRIPDDVAVTGFDDADFAANIVPSLTTIRQDALGMGTAAAEAVLRMLEDPESPPPVVVIETELVVRDSSGPATS